MELIKTADRVPDMLINVLVFAARRRAFVDIYDMVITIASRYDGIEESYWADITGMSIKVPEY